MSFWAVATTKPQAERRARGELEAAGLAVMAPTYQRVSRHARRTIERTEPHLRRYLVVKVDDEAVVLRAIRGAKHASKLLMSGDRIARLKPGEAERVEALQGIEPSKPPAHQLRRGQVVQILEGPFSGWSGPIVYCNDETIKIALQIMGKPAEIPCSPAAVRAITN
jgi:transcription antitermination factor NusG